MIWGLLYLFLFKSIKINKGTLINMLTMESKEHIIIKERYLSNKEKVPH